MVLLEAIKQFYGEENLIIIGTPSHKEYSTTGDQVYFLTQSSGENRLVAKVVQSYDENARTFLDGFLNKDQLQEYYIVPYRTLKGEYITPYIKELKGYVLLFPFVSFIDFSKTNINTFPKFYGEYRTRLSQIQQNSFPNVIPFYKRILFFYNQSSFENIESLTYSRGIVKKYLDFLPNFQPEIIHSSPWKKNLISTIDGNILKWIDIDSFCWGDPYFEYFYIFSMIAEACSYETILIEQMYKPVFDLYKDDPFFMDRMRYVAHFSLIKSLSHNEKLRIAEFNYLKKAINLLSDFSFSMCSL